MLQQWADLGCAMLSRLMALQQWASIALITVATFFPEAGCTLSKALVVALIVDGALAPLLVNIVLMSKAQMVFMFIVCCTSVSITFN